MIFVVVIIIDACFPDYDASLNQKGTVPSFQMNLEMLHQLEIMQICCKIMEYIYSESFSKDFSFVVSYLRFANIIVKVL